METIAPNRDESVTLWETVSTRSRYGQYASEVEDRAFQCALALCKEPTSALEIGCDGGRWTKLLADAGWSVTCTDIEQNSLAVCKQRVPTATCIQVAPNAVAFPAEKGSQDLMLCIEVAPVIHADWFMDEAFRILRRGGILIGVAWNRASWRGALYHAFPALRVSRQGNWYWYPDAYPAWRQRLRERGFRLRHEEGYAWLPCRRTSDSRFIPAAATVERMLGLRKMARLSPMIAFVAQKL